MEADCFLVAMLDQMRNAGGLCQMCDRFSAAWSNAVTVSVCYDFSKSQCSVVALNQHKDVHSSCCEILSVRKQEQRRKCQSLTHTHTHTHAHMHARSPTHTWMEDALQGAAVTSPASRSTVPMH